MVLINAHGDKTVRQMTSNVVEQADAGDRLAKLVPVEPADVKGTRMLNGYHTKPRTTPMAVPTFKGRNASAAAANRAPLRAASLPTKTLQPRNQKNTCV